MQNKYTEINGTVTVYREGRQVLHYQILNT